MNTTRQNIRIDTTNTNREFPLERIRNIGIAAHIDAGKTTLTERILFFTGAIHRCGEVHDGTTTTDHMDLEKEKGITITAAAIPCAWTQRDDAGLFKSFVGQPHRLNIIDTPGHVDFTVEVERSLRVLDGAVAVFCAVGGVQPQSETVWRQAERYGVPRIAFINKMDRLEANFMRVVEEMRTKLGANAHPVLMPLGAEDRLRGQIDLVNERAILFGTSREDGYSVEEVPPELRELARKVRLDLINALADIDDAIAALVIENQPVPTAVLKAAIRRQTIANRFVPVIGGSAYKFKGVQLLIDAIVDYLPSPKDLPPIKAHSVQPDEPGVLVCATDEGPVAALAFKVVRDKQAGRLVYLRIYSGTLAKGNTVYLPRLNKKERIGRLLRLHADKREEIAACCAGDIVAITGAKHITTGDTLCDVESPVLLARPSFPDPVVSMAIEPEAKRDQDKMVSALQCLCDEDPTFRMFTHPETGQTLIAGMGELHLDIMRERLRREFDVSANAGKPQIAYRETITAAAEADHLLKKQSGGAGMYARVIVRVRPNERSKGATIEDKVVGGRIPRQFIPGCEKGIEEAFRDGVLGGYPVVDVHVEIVDGHFHPVDSDELSFRLAANAAAKEAFRKAKPVLLEPVMKVECSVPSEYQGDIVGDLNRRRGKIVGVETRNIVTIVHAEVPLAEMFGYANAIRSLSKGRASYSMEPSHFDPVPHDLAVKALSK